MNDKKIKVLHLYTDLILTSGITRSIYSISKNTSNLFEHYILVLRGEGITYFKGNGLNVQSLMIEKRNIFSFIQIIFSIIMYCKSHEINIIHSHHRFFDLASSIVKKLMNIKTLTSVQSIVYGKKFLSYKADFLIAAGMKVKDHLIEYFNIAPQKIKIINNFVVPTELQVVQSKQSLMKRLNLNDDDFVIVFVGRFSKEKGIDVLLKAFCFFQGYNDIKLVLIGEGEEIEEIKKISSVNKNNIKIISPQKQIYDWYNIANLIVLPSRVDPFPLVMLEAGLTKKAFIGSRVDGIAEVIVDEKNGLLVSPGNEHELAAAIKKIYENPEFAAMLAENLHRKVMEYYTVEKIIPEYETLYKKICS
jgi:glycosyltransferase involved in cell wall biosynthesis